MLQKISNFPIRKRSLRFGITSASLLWAWKIPPKISKNPDGYTKNKNFGQIAGVKKSIDFK